MQGTFPKECFQDTSLVLLHHRIQAVSEAAMLLCAARLEEDNFLQREKFGVIYHTLLIIFQPFFNHFITIVNVNVGGKK